MTVIFDIDMLLGFRPEGQGRCYHLNSTSDRVVGQQGGDRIEVSTEPLPDSRHFKQVWLTEMSGHYSETADGYPRAKACRDVLAKLFGTVPTDIYIRKLGGHNDT